MSQAGRYVTGGGGGNLSTLTGNSGGAIGPTAGNINVMGDGTTITVVGDSVTSTLTISALGDSLTWVDVPGNSQTMVPNTGYVADDAVPVVFTLPVTAAFGTRLFVVGNGSGGWQIAQHAGQAIRFGSAGSTTVGVGGSIASTNQYDMIQMLCVVANTDWNVITVTGNITIV